MYQLIRQKGRVQDRTFEIEFADRWRGLFFHVWLNHDKSPSVV